MAIAFIDSNLSYVRIFSNVVASHRSIQPMYLPPATIFLSSRLKAILVTALLELFKLESIVPDVAFQIITVPSRLPEAILDLSDVIATENTKSSCPCKTNSSLQRFKSQIRTVLSQLPDTPNKPSALIATAATESECG